MTETLTVRGCSPGARRRRVCRGLVCWSWWCRFACFGALVLGAGFAAKPTAALEPLEVYSVMFKDPDVYVVTTPSRNFDPALIPLWLKALQRPEVELRQMGADTIARAHAAGMPGAEAFVEPLAEILKAPEQDDLVCRAAAHALVVLDARQQAAVLAALVESGNLQVAQVVEPALAKWEHEPIRDVWLERLRTPGTPPALLLMALHGLGDVREPRASELLMEWALRRRAAPNLRIAAARALAQLHSSGLVETSQTLSGKDEAAGITDRLVSAALLRSHDDAEAIRLLTYLTNDTEPAVAAMAYERLLAIDPPITFDLAANAIQRRDAKMRRLGAESLYHKNDVEAIRALGPMLDDVNPGVRGFVCSVIFEAAAQEELLGAVIDEATTVLHNESWRGIEQASLVLGELDYEPASERFVELLRHERREANVAAAWALGRIKVESTLPPMLEQAERQYQACRNALSMEASIAASEQLGQLFQCFGEMQYEEAEPLMRKLIPQNFIFDPNLRAAACWGLGWIHADDPQDDLAKLFVERMMDTEDSEPEDQVVRQMCSISLGRMKAVAVLDKLRYVSKYEGSNGDVGRAVYWAVKQMTGEPIPPPVEVFVGGLGWFLEPNR